MKRIGMLVFLAVSVFCAACNNVSSDDPTIPLENSEKNSSDVIDPKSVKEADSLDVNGVNPGGHISKDQVK